MDISRALCALEIIAFWHALDYMNVEYKWLVKYGFYFTKFSLSVFTFISGFFLSKYILKNKQDIVFFYKKRFKRFYPLFLISSISLLLGGEIINHSWYDSYEQFFLTITGFSLFCPPMAGTLWYISMLMFFYMITPIILYTNNRKWICSLFLLIGFVLIGLHTDVDKRLFLYFPFYILGLCINKRWFSLFSSILEKLSQGKKISLLVFESSLLVLSIYGAEYFKGISFFIITFIGSLAIILMSYTLSVLTIRCNKILSMMAYSSMVAYLFHRQIYECFRIISPNHIIPMWLMAIAIICIFTLSYHIQKFYDYICNRYLI